MTKWQHHGLIRKSKDKRDQMPKTARQMKRTPVDCPQGHESLQEFSVYTWPTNRQHGRPSGYRQFYKKARHRAVRIWNQRESIKGLDQYKDDTVEQLDE